MGSHCFRQSLALYHFKELPLSLGMQCGLTPPTIVLGAEDLGHMLLFFVADRGILHVSQSLFMILLFIG